MPTTPTLGGTTMPDPYEFRERHINRGAYREMADGTVVTDLVNASVKRTFELSWRNLTHAQRTAVTTAWATIDDSSATFRAPNYEDVGGDYLVTRDPSNPVLEMEAVGTPSQIRWNMRMTLRQV